MLTAKAGIKKNYSTDKDTIDNYIQNISIMSKATAYEYLRRLNDFTVFVVREYDSLTLDDLITKVKKAVYDPYSILSRYAAYLQNYSTISTLTLKQRVVTVKNFLEYHDVDLSPRKFKLKVKLPRVIRKSKEALSKEDVIDILNECSDIRLKTYVMLLAGSGMRATEALSIRIKDLDLTCTPAKVSVSGTYKDKS